MIIIPEIVLLNSIKSALKYIRLDFDSITPTTDAIGGVTVVAGVVTGITITNGGSGYLYPPVIKIVGVGTGAIATAVITGGVVTSIIINNGGIGYTTTPTITFIPDESKTLLYRILSDQNIQRYKLYEQGKAVFLATTDNPRILDVNMFFNSGRAHIPTIHITLPSETTIHNTLGIGEGFRDPIFDTTFIGGEESATSYKETYNRRFKAAYNLVITSDNTNEVVLIYHFLRSMLISMINHLNLAGLENINLGGRDIQLNSELVPNAIFVRAISLDFEYDVGAVALFGHDVLHNIIVQGETEI